MSKSVIILAFLICASAVGRSAEIYWVGGDETAPNDWKTAANWEGGKCPGKKDIAVFDTGSDVTVSSTAYDDKIFNYSAGIAVRSGNVTVSLKSYGVDGSSCKTGTLEVAAGSTLTFSTKLGATNGAALRKTGTGTVSFSSGANVGLSAAGATVRAFQPLIIAEGAASFGSTVYGNVNILEGAKATVTTYGVFASEKTGVVTVDGTLNAASSGSGTFMNALNGSGLVKGGSITILMTEDCAFSGRFEGSTVSFPDTADHVFTVGGAKTLADVTFKTAGTALAFVPGVGEFWIDAIRGVGAAGGDFLTTEDAAGDPVTLHVTTLYSSLAVRGTGRVLCNPGSGKVATLTGAHDVQASVIGVESGTLRLGDGADAAHDFDASQIGRFQVNSYLTLSNVAETTYTQPFDVEGTLSVRGPSVFSGKVIARDSSIEVRKSAAFGDIELGTTQVTLDSKDAAQVTAFANAEGTKLELGGVASLALHSAAGETEQSAVIGPAGATECPIARENGGILLLRKYGTDVSFDGSGGTVKVNGGVPTDAKGRVTLPIFTLANTAAADGGLERLDFVKYDSEKGLVEFTDYTENSFDGGADSVVRINQATTHGLTLDGSKTVAALNLVADTDVNYQFTIPKNTTLTIGGAAGVPACLLLQATTVGEANVGGYGTLSFGASEGVIVASFGSSYTHTPTISTTITTTGGITYAAVPDAKYPFVRVTGSNAYTGGTRIHGIQVRPESRTTFGRGLVRVGDGALTGGQVYFTTALTITNDFSISGTGVAYTGQDFDRGAFWFGANVTLTGGIELRGRARVSSSNASATGTLKGVVSGGALQIMKASSPLVLEGANTYTGGTEIVSSTLVLKGVGTAGTGPVTLDNGVLRFENTVPMTFANDLAGVGTIEVVGTAPVTFAGKGFESLPFRTLAPGSTVDYPACENATYVVGGTDIDIDLKGHDRTVAGVLASGTIRGGTLTVTGTVNPGGEGAVGTLTFERMPVLDGVSLVIETEDGAVDKVVVPDDLDVSRLDVDVRQLGKPIVFGTTEFLSCGGELTGPFGSVSLPEAKRERYEVVLGETAARLAFTGAGILLIVR